MATRIPSLISISLLAFGLIGGCSLVIDVDNVKQCSTNADCQALGPAFVGATCEKNLCVAARPDNGEGGQGVGGAGSDEPDDPLVCKPREVSKSPTVKYTFAPVFFKGAEPAEPKPFSVKACETGDFTCAHPIVGPVDVVSDVPYDFEVPVGASGFTGYFEISNPDTPKALLFMGRPVVEDTIGWGVTMPTPELVGFLAASQGEMVDPDAGIIQVVARDCNTLPLAGVTVTSTNPGLSFYFVNFQPDTSLMATGPQGAAGFVNVKLDKTSASISGVHESGKKLGPVSVRLQPSVLSFVELWP